MISRRLFLIGSAATLVAATLPEPVEKIIAASYKTRLLWDMYTVLEGDPGAGAAEVTVARISRGIKSAPLLHFHVGAGGIIRWSTCNPLEAIPFLENHLMAIDFQATHPSLTIGRIQLTCEDDGRQVVEDHIFANGKVNTERHYLRTGQ